MKSSVSRPIARRARNLAASLFYLGAAMAVPCGLMACFSGSGSEIPSVMVVKRIPEVTESIAVKISPVITGLADGRILAAWASHVPEPGKAWRTDWKWFDERGEPLGQGFDWVSYPGRVIKTVSATGATDGAVIASIVEFSPGQASEIYVREFRLGGSQIDPGVISLPGARLIVDIALLALDNSGQVLAIMGSTDNGPAIWSGRFDRTGSPTGEIFSYIPAPADRVFQIEQPMVSRLRSGGWVCYWIEHRSDHPLSIMSQAFSADGKPDGLRHRTGIGCGDDRVFGVFPILPYGDGRLLVLPKVDLPSCAYTIGPEGDSLNHPDLTVSLNTSRPMTHGKPGTNYFIALAGRHPNASTEIELLDSAMNVVQRRTFPGGPGQELALTRTASGLIALLNLQAPYLSASPYGLLLMDPRWE